MFGHQKLTMKRDVLRWWFRGGCARRPGRKPVLFAGPWVGEFGWELMNWQAWVRALAPHYEKVVVCARPASEALYQDFADVFVPHGLRGTADHVILRDVENPEVLAEIRAQVTEEMDWLQPLIYVPQRVQHFIRFGEAEAVDRVDVLLHARGKGAASERNWPVSQWEALVEHLQSAGLTVGCVGLRHATLDVPGVLDFRDIPLTETLNRMAAAKLVLGPSSGPMHLASLCGTPHVVWTNQGIYRMGKSSRQKYESWWNPLRTPVTVLDDEGFGATPARVLEAALIRSGL